MSLPASLPEKFDPALPLSDPRYERFSQLRVIGVAKKEAAWEAGFRKEGAADRPILPGNAARLDRHPEVMARKAYLAKDDDDVIMQTRLLIRERLMAAATLDVLADYAIIGTVEVGGKKVSRVIGIDWRKLKNSEHSAVITKFKFDPETGVLVDFDRDDPMGALNQLRDMYGLRAPRKKEHSGPNGGPMQHEDVTRYTDDELAELERIQLAAQARRTPVAHADPGGD